MRLFIVLCSWGHDLAIDAKVAAEPRVELGHLSQKKGVRVPNRRIYSLQAVLPHRSNASLNSVPPNADLWSGNFIYVIMRSPLMIFLASIPHILFVAASLLRVSFFVVPRSEHARSPSNLLHMFGSSDLVSRSTASVNVHSSP